MQGFLCVYRRYLPAKRGCDRTYQASSSDPMLKKFLDEYWRDDRYYDWGDDPSFFAAEEFLDDVRQSSWGVCRRDVRSRLKSGDMVVFFCARPRIPNPQIWDYYYVGFGTVRIGITRWQLWQDPEFQVFRQFYNVLAMPKGSKLVQKETFHPYHADWKKRADAPYVLFEQERGLTHFNLKNPLWVATYDGDSLHERWNSGNSHFTAQLERLLFVERGITRGLRSSPTGFSHQYINLAQVRGSLRPGRSMDDLRKALNELSEAIAGCLTLNQRMKPTTLSRIS